jgi:hypothetical protein
MTRPRLHPRSLESRASVRLPIYLASGCGLIWKWYALLVVPFPPSIWKGVGPSDHLVAASVTDTAGRFALRAEGGSYTLEISYLGHEPHRQQVSLATAPVNVGRCAFMFSRCWWTA